MLPTTYTADLKESLTGDRDARFVWLCNFEVERQWARDRVGLPAARVSATTATVQRMEELGALLAEPGDCLLLDRPLDREYRDYLEKTGLGAPAELVTEAPAGPEGTSGAVLESPELLAELRQLAERGAWLLPMGHSPLEQRITELTGLPAAAPRADVCERVNSKIYSRHLVRDLGLREIPGASVHTVAELRRALEAGLSDGGPVIVKDAYGVSGRGLLVLDNPRRADQLLRMVDRRAARGGDDRLHVVVEAFLAKRFDLNYQFTIDRAGRVRFDFVKQALTADGVHLGHLMPPELTTDQHDELERATEALGARLYRDGFFGVVGVDALLGADERIYPVVEINARLNMSTYQGRVTERFLPPDGVAMAKHYPLRLEEPVSFGELADAIGVRTEPAVGEPHAVITCFGTVNAQDNGDRTPFDGRLYVVLFARDRAELDLLDRRVTRALEPFQATGRTS
ncbi:ATP-grasp domain-containing protein [Streptomyces sp. NPDC001250]|uniref:preATP grasp domain-containing protein n=1 Tax=unclassified Streptomyces TaxID=2593676 RepID=UPI00331CE285